MSGMAEANEPPYDALEYLRNDSADTVFIEDLQRRAVLYFVEQTDLHTGLTRDRAPADGEESDFPASIAATGFALTGWCIADARGWMEAGEARERARRTLRFVWQNVAHEHGWFYHFVYMRTGERAWRSEASTIDTALFLKGALAAREYFDDPEIRQLVNAIYSRIDWQWAMNGGTTLTHGWIPESGFHSLALGQLFGAAGFVFARHRRAGECVETRVMECLAARAGRELRWQNIRRLRPAFHASVRACLV